MAGILGIYGMIVAVIISQRGINISTQSNTMTNTPTETVSRIWPQVSSADSVALYLLIYSGCWLFDWKGGRCWYQSQRPAGTIICGPHSDPHFWWSFGPIWSDRITYPHLLIIDTLILTFYHTHQSVSFSPMHLTLCRLNQLSLSAILPRLTINLSGFWVTLDFFTKIWHWVLGTAKIQFLPL